jgi:CRP-like cAMP-binding protein
MLGLGGNHGQVRGMLGAGRSFGERALLLNEPRAATIQVRAPCKCA